MDALLKKLYYDPKTGFIGAQALYQKAKELNPKITFKIVRASPAAGLKGGFNLKVTRLRPGRVLTLPAASPNMRFNLTKSYF